MVKLRIECEVVSYIFVLDPILTPNTQLLPAAGSTGLFSHDPLYVYVVFPCLAAQGYNDDQVRHVLQIMSRVCYSYAIYSVFLIPSVCLFFHIQVLRQSRKIKCMEHYY